MRRRTTLLLASTYLACGAAVGTTTSHAEAAYVTAAVAAQNPFACQGPDHRYSRHEFAYCILPAVFTARAAWARAVTWCESEWKWWAANPTSSARGSWQFLGSTWAYVQTKVKRIRGKDRRHYVFATLGAWWLSRGGTDGSQWVCKA